MWWARKQNPRKKTSEYRVKIVLYDNGDVGVLVGDGVFHDRDNLLAVAASLEKCAALIKGENLGGLP